MATTASKRRLFPVLLAVAMALFSTSRADALFMSGTSVQRRIDWTIQLSGAEVGIAEEQVVQWWIAGIGHGEKVQSVGTAIHFGFGTVTAPCRLPVFVTAVVGFIMGVVVLAMLPSLRQRWARWAMSREAIQN